MSQEQEVKERPSPARQVGGQQATPNRDRRASLFLSPQSESPSPSPDISSESKEAGLTPLSQWSSSPRYFQPNPLDAPIARLLTKLSTKSSKVINAILLVLIQKGKFAEVAEWFVENQATSEAKALREKLDAQPLSYRKNWYAVLSDPSLYGGHFPLKPHVLQGATLKGFKELHPFELLLGEHCRLQRRDDRDKKRGMGLFYILHHLGEALRHAENANSDGVDREAVRDGLVQSLADMTNHLGKTHPLHDFLGELSLLLSVSDTESSTPRRAPADTINFEEIRELLSVEVTRYRAKYEDYLACGLPSHLLLLEDVFADAVVELEKNPTRYTREEAHKLFQTIERACEQSPSSVTYCYYSVICKALANYFEAAKPEPAEKSDSYWKEFYLERMMYGAILSARLFEHDSNIVHNTFQGEDFKESRFLKCLQRKENDVGIPSMPPIPLTPPTLKQALVSQFPEIEYFRLYDTASKNAALFIAENLVEKREDRQEALYSSQQLGF